MHLLDLVLLVIIIGWGIVGAYSGIVTQLTTLLSLVFAVTGAWMFYPIAAYKLEGLFESPEISVIVAPLLLFIIIGLLSKIVINLFCKVIFSEDTYKRGWLLGGSFGILKGAVVCGVLVFLLGEYGKPDLFEDSTSFKPYYGATVWAVDKSEEYGITEKLPEAGNYIRDAVLPPDDTRDEAIKTAANSFYQDDIVGFFDRDLFCSISDFLSSKKEALDSD